MRLGSQRAVQVPPGVGIVRLESQGFSELLDRLVGAALPAERGAEVVVDVHVIRFQTRASWNWRMASSSWPFWPEDDAAEQVGLGVIRFQAEALLELTDGLADLAFLAEDTPRL